MVKSKKAPLQKVPSKKKAASVFSGTANLANTIVGAGILGLPFAFAKSGLVPAILIFLVMILLSYVSFTFLMYAADATCLYTLGSIGGRLFGPIGIFFVGACTFLQCFGFLWAYVILVGDFILSLLRAAGVPEGSVTLQRWFITIILGFFFFQPLSWFRRVDSLKTVSSLAIIAFIYAIIVVFIRFVAPADGMPPHIPAEAVHPSLTIIQCFSTLCFAFGCQQNIPIIQGELGHKSIRSMKKVAIFTLSLVGVLYLCCSLFGYIQFTDLFFSAESGGNILTMYPDNDVVVLIARIGFIAALICSYPVMMIPTRAELLGIIRCAVDLITMKDKAELKRRYSGGRGPPPLIPKEWKNVIVFGKLTKHHFATGLIGSGMTVIMCVLAIFLHKVSFVFDIFGSTAGTCVTFVVPCMFFIRVSTQPWRFVNEKRLQVIEGLPETPENEVKEKKSGVEYIKEKGEEIEVIDGENYVDSDEDEEEEEEDDDDDDYEGNESVEMSSVTSNPISSRSSRFKAKEMENIPSNHPSNDSSADPNVKYDTTTDDEGFDSDDDSNSDSDSEGEGDNYDAAPTSFVPASSNSSQSSGSRHSSALRMTASPTSIAQTPSSNTMTIPHRSPSFYADQPFEATPSATATEIKFDPSQAAPSAGPSRQSSQTPPSIAAQPSSIPSASSSVFTTSSTQPTPTNPGMTTSSSSTGFAAPTPRTGMHSTPSTSFFQSPSTGSMPISSTTPPTYPTSPSPTTPSSQATPSSLTPQPEAPRSAVSPHVSSPSSVGSSMNMTAALSASPSSSAMGSQAMGSLHSASKQAITLPQHASSTRLGFTPSRVNLSSTQSIHSAMDGMTKRPSFFSPSYAVMTDAAANDGHDEVPDAIPPELTPEEVQSKRLKSGDSATRVVRRRKHTNKKSVHRKPIRRSKSGNGSTTTQRMRHRPNEPSDASLRSAMDEDESAKERSLRKENVAADTYELDAEVVEMHQNRLQELLVPKKHLSLPVCFAWTLLFLGVIFGLMSLAMAIIFDTDLHVSIGL